MSEAAWTNETRLGNQSAWGHSIAAEGGTVHMIYGDGTVRYRRSTNEGESWSSPVTAASGNVYLTDAMAASGSDVWILYFRDIREVSDIVSNTGKFPRKKPGNMYLKRSRDGGQTWGAEVTLTSTPAFRASMAVSGNVVHVTWMGYRHGKWAVYYRRSMDRGSTWEPEVTLVPGTNNAYGADRPQIAASGNSVHIVWHDGRHNTPPCAGRPMCLETYYKRSLDGGKTWGSDVRLTTSPKGVSSHRADIAVTSNNTVVVAYQPEVQKEVAADLYVRRSTDNGTTWLPPQKIASGADHPDIIASGSRVHLAWFSVGSNQNVYYRQSTDGGATWTSTERINTLPGGAHTPLQAVSQHFVHALWLDNRSGSVHSWYRRQAVANTAAGDGAGAGVGSGTQNGGQSGSQDGTQTGGSGPASAPVTCHLLTPGTAVPAGFGAPWNATSRLQELLLRAFCSASDATLEIGNGLDVQYIYEGGYEWRHSSWQPFTYSGARKTGSWLIGAASATRTRSPAELADPNFFVAYVCTWMGSPPSGAGWKCGCRDFACMHAYWQLQAFKK